MMRLTLLALAMLVPATAMASEPRIALIIGNSTYGSGPLPNPANDAKLLGDTPKRSGSSTTPVTGYSSTAAIT
jgi:hypothetical protein